MKLGYKYRVRKRGRGRDLDSGVNRDSLAYGKPRERISIHALLFKFVNICSFVISNYRLKYTLWNIIQSLPYLLFYCYNY